MPTVEWDPAQYERFRRERTLPFEDLLALVKPRPGMRVVDLGCGTGELTRRLHEALSARETIGLDTSEGMLAKSAGFAGGGLSFLRQDVGTWEPDGAFDLVFSNAALHFVPDHERLFARLASALAPEGQVAAQIPANQDFATHRVATEVAGEEPFATLLGGWSHPDNRLAPEEYARLLDRLGFPEMNVRMQVYTHRLPSRDDVFEWVKGSLLNEYKARLSPADFEAFLARYRERLLARLPDARPFFFTFKRLLLWAGR
ncbi:MAG: methyltransferase domain-containing protein [Acidobacteria bacterium]|nr:MAG: methyltransferase domain-containing protein [Acidobacteriota bacterium]MCE7956582.1 methyltransferase domain-containing protein [Acidobacteria bacterium ACB2]